MKRIDYVEKGKLGILNKSGRGNGDRMEFGKNNLGNDKRGLIHSYITYLPRKRG